MKSILNLYFFLLILSTFNDKTYSLTDYQIKKICKKDRVESICIKNLKEKKSNLQKGDKIEIPVIPYKRHLKI